ncbi:MAG: hypothetical protein QOJ64_3297, partial [Acidobacteriota bacterium]|nr:hypothetical protein [Acidobacteriota bacterium]
MRNPFSKRLHLPVLGFGLVLIIGSFFTYYLFYVSKQTSYFTNRNLRMLAALSNHVEEKVASLSGVFSNAAKDFAEKCEAEPKCFESLKKNDKASPDAPIVDFQSAALDVLKGDGTYLSATNIEIIAKPENGDSLPADPEIEIKQEEGKRWLYLQYTFRHTPTKPTVQVASEKNGSGAMRSEEEKSATFWTFRARTNLKDLIGPFVNQREVEENKGADHQDGLDAILIADVDNDVEVIFQESPAELHVASLRNLKLPGAEESKGDLSAISQSTSLVDVEIAGDVYKLFVQPIDLPLDKIKGDHKHGVRWLACGLIQAGHFRSESWSISYTVLTVLGFITAMVALSWPFIKLASLGPKDRLRRRDAFFLVLSTLIVTALLTFFLLYGSHYSAIEAGLDVRMKTFGGHIRRNFEEEVKAALNELDELNRKPELISAFESLKILNPVGGKSGGKRRDDERQDRPQYSEQDKEQAARDFAENKEKKNILDGPLNDVEPYPYFRSAFWVDPKGEQRIKWTVRKDVTRLVKVAERPYFTNIQRGYLQKLGPHEFVLQPLLSKTTGSNEVVISKAVYPLDRRPWWNLIGSVTPGDSPPEKWVSAIDARFLSLMEPVIPAGFGFAIIDNNGTVLFHSDEKQHLGENFFEECDNNRALRSAVVGRADDLISTQYLGKGHRIYVEPLGNSSWTLVVFRNKEYLRTAISELMTLALILFSTYFILLLLCVLLI